MYYSNLLLNPDVQIMQSLKSTVGQVLHLFMGDAYDTTITKYNVAHRKAVKAIMEAVKHRDTSKIKVCKMNQSKKFDIMKLMDR